MVAFGDIFCTGTCLGNPETGKGTGVRRPLGKEPVVFLAQSDYPAAAKTVYRLVLDSRAGWWCDPQPRTVATTTE